MPSVNLLTAIGSLINRRRRNQAAAEEGSSDGVGYPVQESWHVQGSPNEAVFDPSVWDIRYDEVNRRHYWFNTVNGHFTFELKKPTCMELPEFATPVAPVVYPPGAMPYVLLSPRTSSAMMHGQQQAVWDHELAIPEPGQNPHLN